MEINITSPGVYRTKNGTIVTVHEITDKGTFPVKGSIHKMFRGKIRPRGLSIWQRNGRYNVFRESGLDIVAYGGED